MNDDDLDTRLRDHGTSWRETNEVRPGIDWEAVTRRVRSRNWLAVAGVSVAAAAIVVALVLGLAGVFTGSTRPATHKNAPTPAMKGAPLNFYAIRHNLVWSVDFPTAVGGQSATSDSEGNGHPVALGVANDVKTGYIRTAYAAYDGANCRTTIERHHIGNGESSVGGFTISGHAATTPMSVSPDGTKLALVESGPMRGSGSGHISRGCAGPEQIAVVDLRSHSVRRWSSPTAISQVSELHWAGDDQMLSFTAVYAPGVVTTIQALDVSVPGANYQSAKVVVNSPAAFGGVFWWHGQWAWIVNGSLHAVNGHDGIGKVLARGFPRQVDSVSSDPTGNHLLLTSGDVTYRWDNGHLSLVKGQWTQPGW